MGVIARKFDPFEIGRSPVDRAVFGDGIPPNDMSPAYPKPAVRIRPLLGRKE